jgi:hypothetical protein
VTFLIRILQPNKDSEMRPALRGYMLIEQMPQQFRTECRRS